MCWMLPSAWGGCCTMRRVEEGPGAWERGDGGAALVGWLAGCW